MPYAFAARHTHLLPAFDKRHAALTPADKLRIAKLHAQGWAIRAIAREYMGKCSRRLIQFILFPERLELVAEQFRLRRLDGRYYQRARNTAAGRKYRRRKQKLLNRQT